MKNLFNKTSCVLFCLFSLILFSCKKENVSKSISPLSNDFSARQNEVAEDNWNAVSKVQLLTSLKFYQQNNQSDISRLNAQRPKNGGSTTTDITPPSVTITNPLNGSSISGNVSISISASDNVGVSSVSVIIDGVVLGMLTVSPYNFTWNSTNAADGTHMITATAKDARNNSSYNSITVTKNTTVIVLPPATLPASSFLLTPPVANQGNEGSCVAFATSYAARSIESFYRNASGTYSFSVNIFSPEYVYNQTKLSSDCNSGTAFTLALDLIKNKGVCTWSSMPYSDINGCSLLPDANQESNASNYKIAGYSKIVNSDQTAIKTMIYNRHAVMINVTMDNSFINATPGFIWNFYSGSGALPHALIICGYDDNKHAYKVMNSVGTNWGDSGYSWIDYDYFVQVSSYYLFVLN